MKAIDYHTMDKASWGAGPWIAEPDKAQWPDPVTGLPCLITRTVMGHLCGYVAVTVDHPYYGKDFHSIGYLRAHGGINSCSPCQLGSSEEYGRCHLPEPGEPDNVWWIGFDCGHCFDLSPGMRAQLISAGVPAELFAMDGAPYRDFPYVKAVVTDLALQLSNVKAD